MPAKESKKISFYFAWLAFLCAFEVSRNGAAKTSDDATKGFGRTSGFAFHLFKAHANPPVRPQAKIPRSGNTMAPYRNMPTSCCNKCQCCYI